MLIWPNLGGSKPTKKRRVILSGDMRRDVEWTNIWRRSNYEANLTLLGRLEKIIVFIA